MTNILITGVLGQDGRLLTRYLDSFGVNIYGTSRNKINKLDSMYSYLIKKVEILTCDLENKSEVFLLLEYVKPDLIFHFSGQSSVGFSFTDPLVTHQSIIVSTINLLEGIRLKAPKARFFNASSSEVFGNSTKLFNENSPHNPISPYAVAKSTACKIVENYRSIYGLSLVNGYLFNHESQFRNQNFVTHKIIHTAMQISKGKQNLIELGNINIKRDWGWAEEYSEGIFKAINQNCDVIIASGLSQSLKEFANTVFNFFSLSFNDYYVYNPTYLRKEEIIYSSADISNMKLKLNWQPKIKGSKVALKLCETIMKLQ